MNVPVTLWIDQMLVMYMSWMMAFYSQTEKPQIPIFNRFGRDSCYMGLQNNEA